MTSDKEYYRGLIENAGDVAEHQYQYDRDQNAPSQMDKGLDITHEQIRDDYTTGTSDGILFRDEETIHVSQDNTAEKAEG